MADAAAATVPSAAPPMALPVRLLAVVLVLTAAVLVWLGAHAYHSYREIDDWKDRLLPLAALRGQILQLDEVLTMSARMAAATGDPRWEARYQQHEPVLDAAIKRTITLAPDAYNIQAAAQTDAANLALVEMERQAFDLVRRGRRDEAWALLTGPAYEAQKTLYSAGMDEVSRRLDVIVASTVAHEARTARLNAVAVALVLPLLALGWALVWRATRAWQRTLAAHAQALAELNRSLEQKVAQRTQDLARSNAELEQFAYVASHDLQEPLRMIASYTQLLAKRVNGHLDGETQEFLGFIVDGAKRQQALINDLLTYARLGTKAKPFASVALEPVLAEVTANLQVAIAERAATITHDQLPTVTADRNQLVHLLQNLIGNALKFCKDRPPVIQVSAVRQDDDWVIRVRDNGIGIEPQYLDKIFVIFQRLHGRGEYPGTGIGLAVCKKIIERHGGRIWVESQPGVGSTFAFTLPVAVMEGAVA